MTLSRHELANTFIASTDWCGAIRTPLAGDASNRKYDRISKLDSAAAVLMDASPDKGEDVRPFIDMACHLASAGLSAPSIYAKDVAQGFLLIEDLGDDLFTRVVERDPTVEPQLYRTAIDALIVAQKTPPPPTLTTYGIDAMATTAQLLFDWYLPHSTGNPPSKAICTQYNHLVRQMLSQNLNAPPVLVQRDYHAENLLWLPERVGVARVGLLDFQDAMLGHPAYDLASLLKDARRDVSPATQSEVLEYYITQTQTDPTTFKAAYAACSAQRNLRILGVFTRLCVRDKKLNYPDLMPRVWGNLLDDLKHPALNDLREFITTHVIAPSPKVIARIKAAAND